MAGKDQLTSQKRFLTDVLKHSRSGRTRQLLYSERIDKAVECSDDVADLLATCSTLRSLDDHVGHYLRLRAFPQLLTPASGSKKIALSQRLWSYIGGHAHLDDFRQHSDWSRLRAELQRLADSGIMLSEDPSQLGTDSPRPTQKDLQINTIVIPSRGDMDALRRCIRSISNNCSSLARSCDIIVSVEVEESSQLESMLSRLSGGRHINLTLINLRTRMELIRGIADSSDIPQHVLQCAFVGHQGIQCAVGANRNVLLLQTIGMPMMSLDDDFIFGSIRPPLPTSSLRFLCEGDPTEWQFHPFQSGPSEYREHELIDVLEEHERLLGKDLVYLKAMSNGTNGRDSGMCNHMIGDMLSGVASVTITFNGIAGDPGIVSSSGLQFMLNDVSHERLVGSEQLFFAALQSRNVTRVAPQATIAHPSPCMAGAFGVDNRRLLPPFPPCCINEDGVFGVLLERCFSGAYAAFLPIALPHCPLHIKTYASRAGDDILNTYYSQVLSEAIMDCAVKARQVEDESGALIAVGQQLQQLRYLARRQFRSYLRWLMLKVGTARLRTMEHVLDLRADSPRFWRDELAQLIISLRATMKCSSYGIPIDLPGTTDDDRLLVCQTLFGEYGEVLAWWPQIVGWKTAKRAVGDYEV